MAFLESLVQREMGGRQANTPRSAGLPAPAPAQPKTQAAAPLGGVAGGRPAAPVAPTPFASAPSPVAPTGAGGNAATPGLPPAPGSALPPAPRAAAPVAPAFAGATGAPVPTMGYSRAIDRAPTAADFVGEVPGVSFQTPYGLATRGEDGKVSYAFTPEGEARYQRDLAAKKARFGPLPQTIAALPNLPQPDMTLEGSGFNPFTNSFVR